MFPFPAVIAAVAAGLAEEIAAADEQQRFQENRNRNRQMRDLHDPFTTLTDVDFQSLFRLSKPMAEWLITTINPILPDEGPASSIPKRIQVLVALQFYATGSFQKRIANMKHFCISQSMVSVILTNVTDAINSLEADYIHFPQTEEEFQQISQGFQAESGFPGIVGCIDCTHVAIHAPVAEAWTYVNYKSYSSINVQVTCDHKQRITSFVAYPGGVHDARIWRESQAKDAIETLNEQFHSHYFLLGDAGYPLSPVLMTPIVDAVEGTPEYLYTRAHTHTRGVIKRVFGMLKGRFRCLHKDRMLLYSPEKAVSFFKSCVILHNLIIEDGSMENLNNYDDDDDGDCDGDDHALLGIDGENIGHGNGGNEMIPPGRQFRQEIINTYFLN